MKKQGNYSLTEQEYKFIEEHFQKDELLWKYKRALEEADEEKSEKERLGEEFENLKKEHAKMLWEHCDCISKEEHERLKEEFERKERTINQIDDILEKLFGVTHDIAKPNEFEKILREKIDSSKTIEDFLPLEPIKMADWIVHHFKQGIYPIYEKDFDGNIACATVGSDKIPICTGENEQRQEIREIAEYLLTYCRYNTKGVAI